MMIMIKYMSKTNIIILSGDVIYIKGKILNISKAHFKGGFNYYDYLRYQNIKGQIDIEEVVLIKHKFGLNIFHEKVNNYIKKIASTLYECDK